MHTNTSLPHEYSLADILGKSLSHKEAFEQLQTDPETYHSFQSFPLDEQERLLDFIQGNRGLKILNDDVFYYVMNPTILIVLMEKSPKEFAPAFPHYIHQEVHTFDSGAAMKNLTKTIYISLDNFRFVAQNISNKQDAWLTFLSSDAPADILKLINTYPEFLEYYQDIAEFRRHPKELMLMNMYYKRSKALAMMDRNTEIYMMELMQEEAKQMEKQNAELTDIVAALESNYSNLTNDYATLQEKFSAALAEIDRLTKANASVTS